MKIPQNLNSFLRSVKARLLLLVFLVVLPFMVLLLYSALNDLQANISNSKADAANLGKNAAQNFAEGMNLTTVILSDLVKTNEMRNTNNCLQVYPALRSAYERLSPELTNISLADPDGNIYCAINSLKGGMNISALPEYKQVMETFSLSMGSYSLVQVTNASQLNLIYPVLSFNGSIQTLIIATFDTLWIDRWSNTILFPKNSSLGIYATNGTVLSWKLDKEKKDTSTLSANLDTWFVNLLNQQETKEMKDLDGKNRLLTVVPLSFDEQLAGYIVVGYPIDALYLNANYKLLGRLMLSILIIFVAAFIAKYSSESLFLNPLEKVMDVVKRVEAGDMSARVSTISGVGELAALARSFDQMTDSLQQREIERRLSDAKFRAFYDNTAVGVAIMTLDRRITQVNPASVRIVGYTQEEISKIDPSILPIEEDRYIDRELFTDLVQGKREQYLIEKRYLRKSGEMFWGRVNFSLVRDEKGEPSFIVGIIEDITEEKQSSERLAEQEAKHLKSLESRITERTHALNKANELLREKAAQDAVTTERTRLARDLHDAVTQTLFSATLIADVLPEIWEMNINEGKRRLEELRILTRGALAEMRTLLVELRPNALVEVPLPSLLKQLAEALTGRSRISIQTYSEGDRKLPPDIQVALYRLTQEALNNVVKHANASQAVVTLHLGDQVRLSIADNGIGFDQTIVTGDHLGLKIMRERAEAIGASLRIESEAGEGTQITIIWPSKLSTQE